jgi:SAM-dependent methyltransferase
VPPLESLPNAPELFHVYRSLIENRDVERKPGGWVFDQEFYPDYLTVGGASQAIFHVALKFCRGYGVDIGAGFWPLPGAMSVDLFRGPGLGKCISDFRDGELDYIFSSHCLEHISNWRETLDEWVRKLRDGGVVFLYLPHPECAIWHPGSPFVGDSHKWIPEPKILKQALNALSCTILEFHDGPDAMQSFYVCGQKVIST